MIKKVFKFGGASVKDAEAVRNMTKILREEDIKDTILVISAMGKTTNAIEKALERFRNADGHLGVDAISEITSYHETIMTDLFEGNTEHPVFDTVTNLMLELYLKLQDTGYDYDYQYDQTVCYGELISTAIISAYLNDQGMTNKLLDARSYIITDHRFRAANPDWDECRIRIEKLNEEHDGTLYITQGFIGASEKPYTTVTLGREGSDFSAAIFANLLDAESLTIWKDVDGIRNADPKRFPITQKILHLSYSEAIELSFYGASVIHPKTIKPLQNKNIPLYVRCFLNSSLEPTTIDGSKDYINYVASYIVKDRQTLVSISSNDFSFMNENNLAFLFRTLDEFDIHSNLIQTSALALTICYDKDDRKLSKLTAALSSIFKVRYNNDLQLFTIRHYKEGLEKDFVGNRKILLEQRNRLSLQLVLEAEKTL